MSEMVLVHNDHSVDYTEAWKDQIIVVPAKGSIKMTRHDANHFLSQYSGTGKDGKPKIKMLRIAQVPGQESQEVFTCNKCGKSFINAEVLENHSQVHKGEVFSDPELEKAAATPKETASPYVTKAELNEKLDALQHAIVSAIKTKK